MEIDGRLPYAQSEKLLEVDFVVKEPARVGDQFGPGGWLMLLRRPPASLEATGTPGGSAGVNT